MIKNIRYAVRQLRKNPTFTLVAVLSLALGIGATSGMFSVADALLLRPLPVPHASEIVRVENSTASAPHQLMSRLDFEDLREGNKTFSSLVAYTDTAVGYKRQRDGLAALKSALLVSGSFFQELGIQPLLGRAFQPEENSVPGRNPVVILSHEFWAAEFQARPDALGERLRLNGTEFTVIGILPASFTGMDQYLRPQLYVPLAMSSALGNEALWNQRGTRVLSVRGRLNPGVSLARAQANLAPLADSLSNAYPATNRNLRITVNTELRARVAASVDDTTLVVLVMTLSLCVLIVACANVAGLLLSRARARSKEMAIRLAVGAKRAQLIGQLLLESALISLFGGLGGISIGYAGVQYFSHIETPSDLPLGPAIQMNLRMLLFTVLISVLSTVFFGLLPALRNTKVDLVPSLKSADADSKGKQSLWGRNGLVISQVAVSMVLLVISTILFRGFTDVLAQGPGYRTDHLLMMSFNPSLVQYTSAQSERFYRQLMDQAERLPGVREAALSFVIPMSNNQHEEVFVPEGYQLLPGQDFIAVAGNVIDPGYFDTMGIPLVSGRPFNANDKKDAPPVAIINQVLAARYFKGQNALGRRLRIGGPTGPWAQVVGVAKTSRVYWVGETPVEFLYLPYAQAPKAAMTLFVHTQADPAPLATAVRDLVAHLDSNQPVFDVRTMEYFYSKRAVLSSQILTNSIGTLGVMGLFLAMVGLYGVIAFSVGRRKREIGLRMAIGADRGQVLRMVLKQGIVLAAAGVFVGVLLSLLSKPLLGSLVMLGSGRLDLLTLAMVGITMLLVTLLAVFAPARRASRIDPMRALRDE